MQKLFSVRTDAEGTNQVLCCQSQQCGAFQCNLCPCEWVRVQASPESLFEATLAEGVPFKVKAAVTDPSGFHPEGEPLELEFRYIHNLAFLNDMKLTCLRVPSQCAVAPPGNPRSPSVWLQNTTYHALTVTG